MGRLPRACREGTERCATHFPQSENLTTDYTSVVKAVDALPIGNAILDGEIVALDADGRPSFQALQHQRTSALALV